MKRFFRFLMAAVVMFGAVACSQYDEQEVVEGQEVTTTFAIGLENLGTRVAGDSGMIDKVAWGIYEHQEDGNGRFLAVHSSANPEKGPADFDGEKAEIEVTLFTGKQYDLVFFGYCNEAFGPDKAYTINWDTRELNVNYEGQKANVEARDAFYHVEPGFTAGTNKTFTLRRPFAQLNVGQSMEDFGIMQLTGNYIEKSSVTVKAYSKMKLTATKDENGHIINSGPVSGDLVDVPLSMNKVVSDDLTVNEVAYKHIAMNYLLVNEKQNVNEVVFQFTENTTTGTPTVFTRTYYNVPLQRNYRTNILGRIISDEYNFEIKIDARFAEPDNDVFHAFQHGGVVNLPSDMEVGHPLVVRSGVEAVLNLNGHTLKNYIINEPTDLIVVEEGATLTINGEGTLEAVSGNDGYTVISEGTVIINGGTFKAGLDKNGEANAVVYARGNGKVFVNGGTFPNDKISNFVLNKKDADRATTTIEVRGGRFHYFNPENNAAEGAGTNFVAEGHHAIQDGDWYEVVDITYVYSVDEFKAAAADESVKRIGVMADLDFGTNPIQLSQSKIIWGNGHTITAGGNTTSSYGWLIYDENNRTKAINVELKDIVMSTNSGGVNVAFASKAVINNLTIPANYSESGRNVFLAQVGGQITINSGEFTVLRTTCYYATATGANSAIYINGGTWHEMQANNEPAREVNGGIVEISGGKFGANPTNPKRDFNPTAWLAPGYKATLVDAGQFYEVTKL